MRCSLNNTYEVYSVLGRFLGWHCKCVPGTDNEVMSIVTHLNKKTVPERAKNLRSSMNLQEYNILHLNLFLHGL